MSAGFRFEIVNDLSQVPTLIGKLAEFARANHLPDRIIGNVSLAVDELVSNVISHGLPPDGIHMIGAAITIEGGRLVVTITDTGIAFNPFIDGPPPDLDSSLEDRRVGGLGIYLVKKLMDETAYRRDGIMNLTMIAKKILESADTGP